MSRSPLFLFLLALAACDDENRKLGDDTGGEAAWNPCTYTTTVVGYEDVTALGFSAADVMAVAGGPRAEVLEWWIPDESPRPTTDLTLGLTWMGGEVRYVDAEPREGYDTGTWEELAGGSEPGAGGRDTAEPDPDDTGPSDTGDGGEMCPDSLELDVTLTFVTADGTFDETVDAELYALDLDAGRLSAEILYDDLAGTYVPTDPTLVPDEWEDFAVTFSGEVSATASEGDVSIGGHRDMGDGTAMAFQGVEAVWPPGSEPW